jgi:hypothetical protein
MPSSSDIAANVCTADKTYRPAHVHVWEGRLQAVFNLNCPAGPIELRENFGFSWPDVNRLAKLLQTHLQPLCAAWRMIHGNY